MIRSHSSRSLAALPVAYLSGFVFASTSRANTAFKDYTGADPLFKKFTLNTSPDDVGPGAATTAVEHAPNADEARAAVDQLLAGDAATAAVGQDQLQAQNVNGAPQADAIETAGNKPVGEEQQQ